MILLCLRSWERFRIAAPENAPGERRITDRAVANRLDPTGEAFRRGLKQQESPECVGVEFCCIKMLNFEGLRDAFSWRRSLQGVA